VILKAFVMSVPAGQAEEVLGDLGIGDRIVKKADGGRWPNQSDAGIDAFDRPASGRSYGVVGQGGDMQDG
jgi:hypothetical protein